ncbi:MAG: thioesterase family protein [Solirubrobacterales bacterium]|nr:thioesterase family protein [Solirubrobacterales bacterium]
MSIIDAPAGSRFDRHTAVQDGVRAEVDGSWSGYLGAHGGYVAAIALRAARYAVDDCCRAPRALTVSLLEPVAAGRVDLDPRLERHGGSVSTVTVRAEQDGRPVALALATFGAERAGLAHAADAMPSVAPPEDCAPLGGRPVPQADMSQYVEYRPAIGLPLSGGDEGRLVVWMRLSEHRPVDAAVATFLADAVAPALYGRLAEYVAMPTVELSVHYAAAPDPAPEWVLADVRNRRTADGYAVEDGELWAPDGRLLLHTRQLRRVLG